MEPTLDPHVVFPLTFCISSFAGMAAHLRAGKEFKTLPVITALLNSGFFGLGICFLWFKYYQGKGDLWFLFGVCTFAGLGGATLIDFTVEVIKQMILRNANSNNPDKKGPNP